MELAKTSATRATNRGILRSSIDILMLLFLVCLTSGQLLQADAPRDPDGRTEAFSMSYGRYDDFDGHGCWRPGQGSLAVEGELSVDLWNGRAEVVSANDATTNPDGRGYVLSLSRPAGGDNHTGVGLRNPATILLESVHSLSADVLIPSGSPVDTNASIGVDAWLEDLPNPHWGVSLDIGPRGWQEEGEVWINACWNDVGVEDGTCEGVPGLLEHWYDLRIDLKRGPGNRLEVVFFVDGVEIASATPANAELLFEPGRIDGGVSRSVNLWRPDGGDDAVALVDDVWASYDSRRPHSQTLYDDFDGHGGYRTADESHLAVAGELSRDLWGGAGQVANAFDHTVSPGNHGNVLVLESSAGHGDAVHLSNLSPIPIAEIQTFAADVLIPASSDPRGFGLDLQVSAILPGLEDPYWRTWFGFGANENGILALWGCWDHMGVEESTCRNLDAQLDTWYTVRVDLVPFGRAVRADLYVNDLLLQSGLADPTGLLLDQSNLDEGLRREIYVWSSGDSGQGVALVDDVYATYHRITLESITPGSLQKGETATVTFSGEGFREGAVPYGAPWGVSFVDVEVVDSSTMTATAVVHDSAATGLRDVFAASSQSDRSNPQPLEVLADDTPPALPGRYGLYDDFDGHGGHHPIDDSHLAVPGQLSPDLWRAHNRVQVVAAADVLANPRGHGRIARVTTPPDGETWSALDLINPEAIEVEMIGSTSVEVMIPPVDSNISWNISLNLGCGIPELDDYWNASLGLSRNNDGTLWVHGGWRDLTSERDVGAGVEAEADRWYTLRMDVAQLERTTVVVSLLVDDVLLYSGVPEQSEVLLDSERNEGMVRNVHLWSAETNDDVVAYVDNVRGAYERLVIGSITPSSGTKGERIPVTITGDGFRDGMMPFATEWGVSFVEVEVADLQTIHAVAVVDEIAPQADREVLIGLPPSLFSGPVSFTISEDPSPASTHYGFGLYDDFDGHGGQQRDGNQLAVEGDLSTALWGACRYDATVLPASEILPDELVGLHGSVLQLFLEHDSWYSGRLYLSPENDYITFRHFRSFSADFMLRAGGSAPATSIGLDFHSGGVDGGASWYSNASLRGQQSNPLNAEAVASCNNNGRPYYWFAWLQPAVFEQWYNLRMDIVIVSDEELRIDYFVDGKLKATETPYESPIILAGEYNGFRHLQTHVSEEHRHGVMEVLVDNVWATYRLR